ncbi:Ankyrin-3 [Drechslerella dactyloides]|uniref:Ankyrin-3 n=1 Tax=Drechslerella dactyloides TaxID=74499 RepID=A0AAD6NGQ3_DREDA|nr:Ankyrin-3 [Drechslerella dactyloides]
MKGLFGGGSSKSSPKAPTPSANSGSVSKNRSGAYRATNLSNDMTKEAFEKLLQAHITDEEQKNGIEIQKLDLAPDPVRRDKQMAIFQFHKPPERFSPGKASSEGKFYIDPPSGSKHKSKIKIDSDFWGLTQLYRPEKQVAIDVVALTGLNAHAFGSWTGGLEGNERVMWLRDFIPEESDVGPYCRVMTYGYNATTKARAVHETIDFCRGLLRELNKARSTEEERERPLLLIGHSYGGLVIAQAYNRAYWEREEFGSIYHSIVGICFFGVPWRGINLKDVEIQLESEPDQFDHGRHLLRNINYEGGAINDTSLNLREIIRRTNTRLITFYETLKTKSVVKGEDGLWSRSGPEIIVVPRDSAVLDAHGEQQQDADGDHSSLVKFTGQDNRAYTTIIDLLDQLIEDGEDEVSRRIGASAEAQKKEPGTLESVKSVLRGLRALSPAKAKYKSSQLLRIAVDAELLLVVNQLLDGTADTSEAKLDKNHVKADPNFQARADKNEKYHEKFRWIFDTSTGSRRHASASDSLSQNEKNEIYLAKMLESDATPLSLAINRRNRSIVKLLLEHGADPRVPCSAFGNGSTPVHQACRLGDYDILQLLLNAPASSPRAISNVKTGTFNATPLHEAVSTSHKICKMLQEAGADVNAKQTPNGKTALHIAAERGDYILIVKLRDSRANIRAVDCQGSTALHYAAKEGCLGAVKALLSQDRDLIMNLQNADGNTALHLAARKGHDSVVQELVQLGAQKNIQNRLKETALTLAIERGRDRVVQILQIPMGEASAPSNSRVAGSGSRPFTAPLQDEDAYDEDSGDEDSDGE